jgi:PAS domain S-box-containing protein
MTTPPRDPARDMLELSAKLTNDGWDRLRGARLLHAVNAVLGEARRVEWREGIGRAEGLILVLGEFVRETPTADRLASVLHSANELARLTLEGCLAQLIDPGNLPLDPSQWRLVSVGKDSNPDAGLVRTLQQLGFRVEQHATLESLTAIAPSEKTILLAKAAWVATQQGRLAAVPAQGNTDTSLPPFLVAVTEADDFRTQVRARQAGARLLLDAPLNASRLVGELAGLAWMPRKPYRILMVDDDTSVLEAHAGILRNAGFEVMAVDDPVAALDFLPEFQPEVCVLDVEMPACRGTDLASLLRRDPRYAQLPVIYLSAFGDLDHQLDARLAGGEDYLVKAVAPRLLIAAVIMRARQFRMLGTAHRQHRLALRQLENLKTTVDAHAIVSASAPDGSIIDANEKFCEISGYTRDELIGRNHRIVKSGRHPPAVFEELWQTISGGKIWRGEVQNRRKDGSHYWVQATIVPILDDNGLPEQYISIRTDITEQKRVQEERERQSRLLDAIRQSLQKFIVSHDIAATSSLLLDAMLMLTGSTQGFIGEVLHDPNGVPYHKTHAFANVAWNEDTRRLRDDTMKRGMEFRNLDTLFGAALRSGTPVIANNPANDPRRGVLPDGHPPLDAFLGVPISYGGTLVGIVGLSNRPGGYDPAMIDFLSPLAATYASIIEASRLRQFQQEVIDDLQRTRDAAVQASRTRSDFLASWGNQLRTPLNAILGHAQILLLDDRLDAEAADQARQIVKGGEQFAQQLGDLLERLDSEDAALPLDASGSSSTALPANERQGRHILVAEDNPANQAVLRMQLSVLGFEADIAADGTIALAKWQEGGHDLILADRNMPGMDGLALTRAIRATERENGSYVPIIAITAVHHPEELAACREAGMDDALPKPIELDDLRRLLARWLPRASALARDTQVSNASGPSSNDVGKTLDTDYLARIIGDATPRQVRELVDLFTATARADLPGCRQLLQEANGRGLALAMHKLKSSARMVGALRFAGLAENLESAAKGARLEAAVTLLGELEHALNDVEAAASSIGVAPAPTPMPAPAPLSTADTGSGSGPSVMPPKRVLVIDDDAVARRQIGMLLTALGVAEVLTVDGGDAALAELRRADLPFEILVCDLNMPGMDGIEFLRRLAEIDYRGCLILCSGVEDRLLQTAADLTRAKGLSLRGAVKKPMTHDALARLLATPPQRPRTSGPARTAIAVSPYDLQEGIRLDEFSVHFQPKVDAGTLRVVGVEALARWTHAGKPVSPDAFITAAERHGLIIPLSEMLVSKALIGGARLSAAGFPLMVAVNLSANWLADIRLPEFIMATIHATEFRAENLILEITETGVMTDMATSLDVMTRLRLKGFKLSIDDFGTGYSSMEQLQRIPFGELKLDRAFVQGAAEKPAARAILASTLEMARKLNLSTVAEGVETQADLDLVRGLGCDLVQGWLIAKAMPVEQLIEWLRERGS